MHVKEYIQFLDMLNILNEKIKLREIYEKQTLDPFLDCTLSWIKRIFINTIKQSWFENGDEITGLLKVRVQGFDPQDVCLRQRFLIEVDRFINELSHKISRSKWDLQKIKKKQRKDINQLKWTLLTFSK